MDSWRDHSVRNLALLSLLITAVVFLSFWSPNAERFSLPFQSLLRSSPSTEKAQGEGMAMVREKDEFETALEKASMENKTVIIAVLNGAYAAGEMPNMLDLFLESFWAGEGTRELVDHLLMVAVDQTAYERCIFRGLHCYRLETEGVDFKKEEIYMSEEFIKMMWRRTQFLLDVLRKGFSFIFTDTDVMWLRNPFTILRVNETDDDIQFSTDAFNGDSRSELNPINTGFYYVRSNRRTVALFEKWYGLKDNSTGLKEQDVLQNLERGGALRELNVTARFLETLYFSGFCQDSEDFRSVVTVHANCCRYINAKVADLKSVLSDWKNFTDSPANGTAPFSWSPHVNCRESWIR